MLNLPLCPQCDESATPWRLLAASGPLYQPALLQPRTSPAYSTTGASAAYRTAGDGATFSSTCEFQLLSVEFLQQSHGVFNDRVHHVKWLGQKRRRGHDGDALVSEGIIVVRSFLHAVDVLLRAGLLISRLRQFGNLGPDGGVLNEIHVPSGNDALLAHRSNARQRASTSRYLCSRVPGSALMRELPP